MVLLNIKKIVVGVLVVGAFIGAVGFIKTSDAYNISENELQVHKITAKAAKTMMDTQKVLILDVRTAKEFSAGHIQGAKNLPLDEIVNNNFGMIENKNAIILVYCRSGSRSAKASRLLAKANYQDINDFGGIIDWPYKIVKL